MMSIYRPTVRNELSLTETGYRIVPNFEEQNISLFCGLTTDRENLACKTYAQYIGGVLIHENFFGKMCENLAPQKI